MNSSKNRRKPDYYMTEFGPIDRKTRSLARYFMMALFTLMAIGATAMWLRMDHGPLYDPVAGLVTIAFIDLLLIGFPAMVFFGGSGEAPLNTQDDTTTPSRLRQNRRIPRVLRTISDSCNGFTETVTIDDEQSQMLETLPTETITDKKQKTPDYSYRGEFPKRKRRGYDY